LRYLALLLVFVLTACGDHSSETTAYASNTDDVIIMDQCLRREIFNECLKNLPGGPVATKYNDWDEVVSECRTAAYYMSKRKRAVVKPECEGN
jgi:hypothetical protein